MLLPLHIQVAKVYYSIWNHIQTVPAIIISRQLYKEIIKK
jgi:hypothetical protein